MGRWPGTEGQLAGQIHQFASRCLKPALGNDEATSAVVESCQQRRRGAQNSKMCSAGPVLVCIAIAFANPRASSNSPVQPLPGMMKDRSASRVPSAAGTTLCHMGCAARERTMKKVSDSCERAKAVKGSRILSIRKRDRFRQVDW